MKKVALDGSAPIDLSPKQWAVIDALATGLTSREIAKSLKISRNRIYEWQKDNTFCVALKERGEQIRQDMRRDLVDIVQRSMTAYREGLNECTGYQRATLAVRLLGRIDTQSLFDKAYSEVAKYQRKYSESEWEALIHYIRLEMPDIYERERTAYPWLKPKGKTSPEEPMKNEEGTNGDPNAPLATSFSESQCTE